MMELIEALPPMIMQSFSCDLLMESWERIYERKYPKIKQIADKKIRKQDVGKRREFEKLEKQLAEAYERKKIEKVQHDKEVKEAIQKRPYLPNAGSTCKFTRFKDSKSTT